MKAFEEPEEPASEVFDIEGCIIKIDFNAKTVTIETK